MAVPRKEAFQIGWICALPVEVAAARQMLDENFGNLDEQDDEDSNSYTLGRIGKHYIVIAGLGQYGTTPAATVATNMLRTFPGSLRIGLMVGIGGGIPSSGCDLRLGDIIVSYPNDTCGGVIQYDMGKIGESGKLHRTGCLNSPPQSLLTAITSMKAAQLIDEPLYPKYITEATQKGQRTRKTFSRPPTSMDRLFKIEHEHPETAACYDTCLPEWEIKRGAREEADPQIHYGIIASGNAVIKHGATRERLRQETDALCFEMEAAGLMMSFPCIIIRGVCDYADSHKNKQWQGYAALAAASYAKELLGHVPISHIARENLAAEISGVIDEIKGVKRAIDRAFDQREDHHREKIARILSKEQQECHQALKTSAYKQHKNINPDRTEGTCRWILENSQYLSWRNSNHNDLLWISADPGCGKSVLAKSLVDIDLKTSDPVSVCYFFFKANQEQNNLATALCAVLHQLFEIQPGLLQHALPAWQRNGLQIQKETEELWRILEAAAADAAFSKTICILDALDECDPSDRVQIIKELDRFYTGSHSSTRKNWLKFLVTSRPYDEIQMNFRLTTESFPHIRIHGEEENQRIHEEINLVVKGRVAELGQTLMLSPNVQKRLEQRLLQMEHRTYLWLHLVMDDIRATFRNSLQPEDESIKLIPDSVSAAYASILKRVPSDKVSDVKMILQIIVGAQRPLTIEEMAMALGVAKSADSRIAVEAGLDPKGLDSKIRQLCGLFVFINNSRVYLIHQTAREFLLNESAKDTLHEWSFKQSDTDRFMSHICLKYLLLDDLDVTLPEGNEKLSNSMMRTPYHWTFHLKLESCIKDNMKILSFLQYSAHYWADHVRKLSPLDGSGEESRLDQLYDTTNTSFALWWYPVFWGIGQPISTERESPIHLASLNGHASVVQRLIDRDKSLIHRLNEEGTTALYRASYGGHLEVVQTLLNNGADPNFQCGTNQTILKAACLGGNIEVVKELLNNGADLRTLMAHQSETLWVACEKGFHEIVQLLLENGANVNDKGRFSSNALFVASWGGHTTVVETLLKNGADVNYPSGGYGYALQAASSKGCIDVVRVLLNNGANVNAKGGRYGNALQAASWHGYVKIMQILLDNGADVNLQGGFYGNALQAASLNGSVEAVQTLLDNGANVNAQGREYSNALRAAALQGHTSIIHLLLDNGAIIDAQGGYFGNALEAGSSKGHVEVVKALLDRGADVNAQGRDYKNALQAASSEGHTEVVKILLKYGADKNT